MTPCIVPKIADTQLLQEAVPEFLYEQPLGLQLTMVKSVSRSIQSWFMNALAKQANVEVHEKLAGLT